MRIYTLKESTLVKSNMDTVWQFFSHPHNLNEITPEEVKFQILPDQDLSRMYAGMLIHYKISPMAGMRFRWTTEITQCVDQKYFIDEQRFGPYSLWHHQHHFEQKGDAVLMTDIVTYAIPYGFLGRILHGILIRKKIENIFIYRKQKIADLFGS